MSRQRGSHGVEWKEYGPCSQITGLESAIYLPVFYLSETQHSRMTMSTLQARVHLYLSEYHHLHICIPCLKFFRFGEERIWPLDIVSLPSPNPPPPPQFNIGPVSGWGLHRGRDVGKEENGSSNIPGFCVCVCVCVLCMSVGVSVCRGSCSLVSFCLGFLTKKR